MKDTEAAQIIQQALIDNGREWSGPLSWRENASARYESQCLIEELTEQIVNRLRASGAFQSASSLGED